MTKPGRLYEQVVAEVLRAMDANASVEQGRWVQGPDGRRDMDVFVEGTADGQSRSVLIKCKDFNPKKTGPVGIAYVDALESKSRDLAVDVSFICSNGGFTKNAISKAKRVGIGLMSVMRKGDRRVRFGVMEECYTRRVRIESLTISLRNPDPINLGDIPFDAVTYDGVPIGNWVVHRTQLLLASNPIVNGTFDVTHNLKDPVEFGLPNGTVIASAIDFKLTVRGGWLAQQITIDATGGVYDWLRRRIRLVPGPKKLELKDIEIGEGSPISVPPEPELRYMMDLQKGEVFLTLMLLEGLEVKEPVPDIDSLVEPIDLDLVALDLPLTAYTSSDGF